MILDTLAQHGRYVVCHSGFAAGFRFLHSPDLSQLADGRYELDGDRLFAIVARTEGKEISQAKLEAHDKYIDIQYIISGEDQMGYRLRETCATVETPMDKDRDLVFFADRPNFWLQVPQGMFTIFYPHDAHAPLAGSGIIHKVVVKVAIDGW